MLYARAEQVLRRRRRRLPKHEGLLAPDARLRRGALCVAQLQSNAHLAQRVDYAPRAVRRRQSDEQLPQLWHCLREAGLALLHACELPEFCAAFASVLSGESPDDLQEQIAVLHAVIEDLHPAVGRRIASTALGRRLWRTKLFHAAYDTGKWTLYGREVMQATLATLSDELEQLSAPSGTRFALEIGAGDPLVLPDLVQPASYELVRSDLFEFAGTMPSACTMLDFPSSDGVGGHWHLIYACFCLFSPFCCEIALAALHHLVVGGTFLVTHPSGYAKTPAFKQVIGFLQSLATLGVGQFERSEPTEHVTLLRFKLLTRAGLPAVAPRVGESRGTLTFLATNPEGAIATCRAVAAVNRDITEAPGTGCYAACVNAPSPESGLQVWLQRHLANRVNLGWATHLSATLCKMLGAYIGSAGASGVEHRTAKKHFEGKGSTFLAQLLEHHELHGTEPGCRALVISLSAEMREPLLHDLAGPGPLTASLREFVTRAVEAATVHEAYRLALHLGNQTRATFDGGAVISALGAEVRLFALLLCVASLIATIS